jgi:hypothetical protein
MGSLDVIGQIADGQYFDAAGNILTIRTAAVSYPSATVGNQATPVVAATAGKRIRVLAMALSTSINGPSCYLRDGTAGAQISETVLRNITGSTAAVNYQRSAYYPIHLYETSPGQPLILNCSATGVASVQVVYVLV